LGLLEDGDDLTVGVTGRLHAELSKIIFRKFYSFQRLFAGGITGLIGFDARLPAMLIGAYPVSSNVNIKIAVELIAFLLLCMILP
ncbi:hypothetical protein, partial [Undibacterium sp. Xuan67W]|uniref:hypothetical protein n=1 Tax=Undibacterium sp. Xuan67W TaxID=3413057 RepID=UPI003BF25F2E